MILGSPGTAVLQPRDGPRRLSIDEIFRRTASQQPDTLALIDPPDREIFTDGAPRRLTYAEADRMITAIAGALRRMGIPTDAVIGIQLPNIAENILTLLGVLRAGMIAAVLPLLWRRADTLAALARVGGKALITCGHVGGLNHCQSAMRVASELFSIRYVCGFGQKLPDGVVPLDELFTAKGIESSAPFDREPLNNAASHVGLISFDVGESGTVPVARNHLGMIAGGLGVALESRLTRGARILSTILPGSFAGNSLTLLPWLLSAGTLVLHHPFDPEVLAQQIRDEKCTALILPGPVALRLAEAGMFARHRTRSVVAAWRSPEGLATGPAWREGETALVDVAIFGEAGLLAARRTRGGRPAPVRFGPVLVPAGTPGGIMVAELARTEANTLALRGPMVPRYAFPPGIERSGLPHFRIDSFGLVDTGYACRVDSHTNTMEVTAPPAGVVGVGGYRFPLQALREAVWRIDSEANFVALPDPLMDQRLVGNAANCEIVAAALNAVGVNPLVAAAFSGRNTASELQQHNMESPVRC